MTWMLYYVLEEDDIPEIGGISNSPLESAVSDQRQSILEKAPHMASSSHTKKLVPFLALQGFNHKNPAKAFPWRKQRSALAAMHLRFLTWCSRVRKTGQQKKDTAFHRPRLDHVK